jgi:O-antigen ligase
MPGVVWWLLTITAALTVALFIGHQKLGHWSMWALVNKFGGWFALIAYFLIGTAIVRSGGVELRNEFLRVFLITAAVIACVNVAALPWILPHYTLPFGVEFDRATGGMANSNAFGFLCVVAALLSIAITDRIGYFLTPLLAALWFSASRGALLALVCGVLAYVVLSPRTLLPAARPAAMAVAVIALMTGILIVVDPARLTAIQTGHTPLGFLSTERIDFAAATIVERGAQNARAWDLLKEQPLFGHGLGYFIETTGSTLHNSLLWLLLETGLIGAGVLTAFLIAAVRTLYLDKDEQFPLAMIPVAAAFMSMSLTGEFLYQRHLWMLLGLALAAPPAVRGRT